ncbi:hypothetical protein ACIAD3661 [Acinetobacter baylyi ADP1]|uniref:Uncharacterized protein n=1 Tax=Acinetobacter baylyi (strain ATCC 33305 / BD413 / ADP1) TaxID=62977 RepID=Q6F6M7_ACIAD|nr:hypothetical protein ACIAD3661 [Acinetobacter baylyi ADP1]
MCLFCISEPVVNKNQKKARHPVELFVSCCLGITPVVPHAPDARTYDDCFAFQNVVFPDVCILDPA